MYMHLQHSSVHLFMQHFFTTKHLVALNFVQNFLLYSKELLGYVIKLAVSTELFLPQKQYS